MISPATRTAALQRLIWRAGLRIALSFALVGAGLLPALEDPTAREDDDLVSLWGLGSLAANADTDFWFYVFVTLWTYLTYLGVIAALLTPPGSLHRLLRFVLITLLTCFGLGHLLLGALTQANTSAEVGVGQWASAVLALGLAVAWANVEKESDDSSLATSIN